MPSIPNGRDPRRQDHLRATTGQTGRDHTPRRPAISNRRLRKRQLRRERQQRSWGWQASYKAALDHNPSNNRQHGHAGGQARRRNPGAPP